MISYYLPVLQKYFIQEMCDTIVENKGKSSELFKIWLLARLFSKLHWLIYVQWMLHIKPYAVVQTSFKGTFFPGKFS